MNVSPTRASLPPSLVLTPVSRRPTRLPRETVAAILATDVRASGDPSAPRQALARKGTCASIVLVTVDNLVFLKLCLTSILTNTRETGYEVVVVNNGSTDGTADYLEAVGRQYPHVRTVHNDRNVGFAPATNQGLASAAGNILVLLNDDTVVPRGWLGPLRRHLADPTIGLLGPVTNRAGNESQIDVAYHTYGELQRFADRRRKAHRGETRDVQMLTMFCLAFRRDAYERLGPLDERFVMGMFEDDDYAMRAREAEYRIVCAEDVFVHHFGATSLGRLAADGRYGSLFTANRRRFEEKWQIAWSPHRHRESPEYVRLIGRIRRVVGREVRPASTVAVVSRGDAALLDLPGCTGWHLPQLDDGTYVGYHPVDSDEAIRYLEVARARGAHYLLVPSTTRWWLEHYDGFQRYLARYRLVVDDETCVLFALTDRTGTDEPRHPPGRHRAARGRAIGV